MFSINKSNTFKSNHLFTDNVILKKAKGNPSTCSCCLNDNSSTQVDGDDTKAVAAA